MRWFSLLAAVFLAGCASVEPVVPPRAQALIDVFHLTGRLAVRNGQDGFSGTLDWRHVPDGDELLISGPLGQGAARIVRTVDGVTLELPDQPPRFAADAESLTQATLGFPLPLAGLPYWVQAQPFHAARLTHGAEGEVATLVEDGWQIDYLSYRDLGARRLPGKVFMESGDIKLKLIIDEWQ
jgi:outer membrane lipoprotein LolB